PPVPSPLVRLVPRVVGRVHVEYLEGSLAVHLDDPLALPRYPAEMRHLRREHEVGAGGELVRPALLELLARPEEHRSLDDRHVLVLRVPVWWDLAPGRLPDADDEGTGLL